jgi:hypothetical protein
LLKSTFIWSQPIRAWAQPSPAMLKSTVWAQFVLAMLKSTFLSTTNYRHADTLGGLGSAARDSVSIAVVGFWSLSTTPMLTPPCGAQPTTDMLKPSLGAQLSPAMLKPTFGAKLVLAILKSTFFCQNRQQTC